MAGKLTERREIVYAIGPFVTFCGGYLVGQGNPLGSVLWLLGTLMLMAAGRRALAAKESAGE